MTTLGRVPVPVRLAPGRDEDPSGRTVDLPGCAVRPRSANSNTKHPRLLKLDGRLLDIIQRARAARRLDCFYVFHRPILPGSLGLVWYDWRLENDFD
jgi:hypothetical protein